MQIKLPDRFQHFSFWARLTVVVAVLILIIGIGASLVNRQWESLKYYSSPIGKKALTIEEELHRQLPKGSIFRFLQTNDLCLIVETDREVIFYHCVSTALKSPQEMMYATTKALAKSIAQEEVEIYPTNHPRFFEMFSLWSQNQGPYSWKNNFPQQ